MPPMKASARVVAILTSAAVLLVGMAGSAVADSPTTWVEGESRSFLENLIFFGGSTVALIVGISLFALLTARIQLRSAAARHRRRGLRPALTSSPY